ncbi:MAG: tRNA pseudouridine(13) synthase TruD [Planctomycetes bacterium]|nr:tRNA pseudouridine(13) synthase TruD [Planctomycetota bacterium]MCB9904179.1 tRNA pseudouridine(13) synthase TruD [Planctomycetota bacterium]
MIEFRSRVEFEDYEVEEITGFEPDGQGDHLFLWIEKRGFSTSELIARLAQRLGARAADFGYAGRKDARAVTRQWISIDTKAGGVDEARIAALDLSGVRVLRVERHPRKLRRSQHRGNRFCLRLRDVCDEDLPLLETRVEAARRHGMPNPFGPQRYGYRGLSHELGRRLLAIDHEGYIRELVSPEQTPDTPEVAQLREAVLSGDRAAQKALVGLRGRLPRDLGVLARQLARRPSDWKSALRALPRGLLGIHLSALQSRVFDHVLAHRPGELGDVQRGDVLFLHEKGAAFLVPLTTTDAELAELQARADAFELSPSGPLPGRKLLGATGEPGRREADAFASLGVAPEDFRGLGLGLDQRGARRPLRVPVTDLQSSREGSDVVLRFALPRGSYATTLLEVLSLGVPAALSRLQSGPSEVR